MTHLPQQSPDLTARNIEDLAALFPSVITESRDEHGQLRRAVNFDMLRQLLSKEVVAGDEAYEFTWVGKKAAMVEANRPIRKTLRPVMKDETTPTGADSKGTPYCSSGSKNWDTTENLYIEGDNLDVLKLLQESYLGKVKMIYIDPPYNTGNDFIYRDDFSRSREDEEEQMGLFDEEDNRLFRNTDSNGRFHSDWCSMMYSRLMLARGLLTDDGVIFISIDDNEQSNLRKIGDEVFGVSKFLGSFIWHRRQMSDSRNQSRYSMDHEYILAYYKGEIKLTGQKIDLNKYQNPDNDPRGAWFSADLTGLADKEHRPNLHYDVVDPNSGIVYPPSPTRGWSCSKDTMEKLIRENLILWPSKEDGRPRRKKFLKEIENFDTSFSSMLDVGFTTEGTRALQTIFKGKVFDFPKPVSLIRTLIEQSTSDSDTILDFFSGSATTAQATMEANAKDQQRRKFILVQLPEEMPTSEFSSICEIGKERIRRVGEKIKTEIEEANLQVKLGEEPKAVPDIGFRVLKLDDTNMKDVYYSAGEYTQDMLTALESNIKGDRTDLDLLFGCLLDWGVPLSMPYTSETLEGCAVHTYGNGTPPDLIACFAEQVPETVVRAIAERQPLRVVFRDSSFVGSPQKINVEEIFKALAPGTSVKVI